MLRAAPEEYEGKTIAIIAFEPVEQPVSPSRLAEILPLKMGEPLHLSDVRVAIEQLYATGRFADINVDAELANGEVILRFLTQSSQFVGRVEVEGVPAPPSLGQLLNASKLKLGSLCTDEEGRAAVANLKDVLRENGFYEAQIETHYEPEPRSQQLHIRYVVTPGERARFTTPIVRGSPGRPVEEITSHTRWRGWFGWKRVTDSRVQQGLEQIRRSYQDQGFLMARVALAERLYDAASRRVTPVLTIQSGPRVMIETRGMKISGGRLKSLIPVYEERSVDRELLAEGVRNLTQYAQFQGYFGATVTFTSELTEDGERRIVYNIDRGERHKLVLLRFEGNNYFDDASIRERMIIAPASMQLRSGRFSEDLLRRDLDAISSLYQANGFRDVKVTSEEDHAYRGNPDEVAVSIHIVEGEQYLVSRVELNGVEESDERDVRFVMHSAEGQPYSEVNLAADRDNILGYYYDNGYPDASLDWTVTPSEEPFLVDLHFTVSLGRRAYVREVLISGLSATNPQLVHRRILLNPGEPLSQTRMLETQRRLYDLGIFTNVNATLQNPDSDEQNKYVIFQLKESSRYAVATGFGAEIGRIGGDPTSFDSPGGAAGFSPRVSFDISRLNFRGLGHTVSFKSRVSNLQRRGLVTYSAPQFQGNEDLSLSFSSLWDHSRDVRTFSSRRLEGSVQVGQRWTRSKTLMYRFAYRRVSVDENTLKISSDLIPLLAQPVRVGIFSASYIDDRRNNPIESSKGTYNSFYVGLASKYFGSQTDFLRILLRNSTYHPVGSKIVLARMLTFGWLQGFGTRVPLADEEQNIPLPERFFAGGASSHRGFPENQAGPRDTVTGFPLGGKAMLLSGIELRVPLAGDSLGAVLFHDAGNVYPSLRDISFRVKQRDNSDFSYMVHAVGLGLRYRTPIGPIRVDFAYSMNSPRFFGFTGTREELLFPPPGGLKQTVQRISRFQFHFSLGQAF